MSVQPELGPDFCPLPPLPDIHSEAIRLQVFTHRSYFARPTHIFEDHPDDPSPDNEKFEHLGDTVLGLVVTDLMLEMYPGLRVGPSTKIRALIVGNAKLAEISLKYKLPDKLRLHPAQAITLRASSNIQADVFESFVGGLYMDQGLEPVKAWLNPLFRPYAAAAYRIVRAQHGLPTHAVPTRSPPRPPPVPTSTNIDPSSAKAGSDSPPGVSQGLPPGHDYASYITAGHLALFNQHIQRSNRTVEWSYSDCDPFGDDADVKCDAPSANDTNQILSGQKGSKTTPMWIVRVIVDGEVFGQGKGGTKKSARNEAAKQGLEKLGIFV